MVDKHQRAFAKDSLLPASFLSTSHQLSWIFPDLVCRDALQQRQPGYVDEKE